MSKVSQETISAMGKLITGDGVKDDKPLVPYKPGFELVNFFNEFGYEDIYGDNFPSRWIYVENKLKEVNNSELLDLIIERALDPRRFIGTPFIVEEALGYINEFLRYDGLIIQKVGDLYKLQKIEKELVKIESAIFNNGEPNQEFIQEQLGKCQNKLSEDDYDGAITNSRALLEAILTEIERHLDANPPHYDGSLPKLYKRVQKLLNLDSSQQEIPDSLKQILQGLVSVISGVGSSRNIMSDAHVRRYKPSSHHAKLVVNSAKTIVDFLLGTYEYQIKKDKIHSLY